MKSSLVITVLALVVAGCQTMPPQQRAEDPSMSCFRDEFANPQITVLNNKVGDVGQSGRASLAQFSDTTRATPEEKEALSLWATKRRLCLAMGDIHRQRYVHPAFAVAFSRIQNKLILLTAEVYAGTITWGQFNTRREQYRLDFDSELANIRNNLQAAQAQQAEANAQQANSAIQMMLMQQQIRQQNMPRPLPLPSTTICNTRPTLGGYNTVCN